jgi:serpin B
MVLTNAIYFNAAWLEQFSEDLTQPHPFDANGTPVTVDMMEGLKDTVRYAKGQGYQAVELPFEGQEVSMLILVPDAGTFASFQQGLGWATIEDALSRLSGELVHLKLPRFEFTARYQLAAPLQQLGMVDAFDPSAADFTGIVDAPPGSNAAIFVKKVIHQAFVTLDEEGAEAAAATAIVTADAGVGPIEEPPEPIHLTVDRPFIFVIRDSPTGAVLFFGHVVNPTA